jgi:hypothetical protein
MSAVVRSVAYALAMSRGGSRESLAVVAVEMAYVTLTAGLYAGLQQKALGLRRRRLGDLAIVAGVPGLSQLVDWTVHKATGAPIPHRALAIVCAFTLISALFHRHVMRHGGFLTGGSGNSFREDFRRIPRLVVSFVLWPGRVLARIRGRVAGVRWGHESA